MEIQDKKSYRHLLRWYAEVSGDPLPPEGQSRIAEAVRNGHLRVRRRIPLPDSDGGVVNIVAEDVEYEITDRGKEWLKSN